MLTSIRQPLIVQYRRQQLYHPNGMICSSQQLISRPLVQPRWLSTSARRGRDPDDGKFRLSAHTAFFTALMIPVLGVTLYAGRYGPDDAELEETIRERYQPDIAANRRKNQAMADFFQNTIKHPESGAEDQRLEQVLHGGKGEKKRFHAIDKELYGTATGVEVKHQTEEELRQLAEEKSLQRRRRKKQQKQQQDDTATPIVDPTTAQSSSTETKDPMKEEKGNNVLTPSSKTKETTYVPSFSTKEVVAITAVGIAAAVAGYLAGGGRRN